MKPYAYHLVHPKDREIFYSIRNAVEGLPDEIDLGKDEENKEIELSCHILARAVANIFPVTLKDGYFSYHFEHSWVLGPHFDVIDVYPVAILGGPILVNAVMGSPYRMLYQPLPTESVYGDRFKEASFLNAVNVVTEILKR